MLDAWNRAQHYRDLAEGRLAMISPSYSPKLPK
jgi:hypothetical protein